MKNLRNKMKNVLVFSWTTSHKLWQSFGRKRSRDRQTDRPTAWRRAIQYLPAGSGGGGS